MKYKEEQLEFSFAKSVFESILQYQKAEKMSTKEVADYLIQNYPSEFTLGSLNCAVLDKAILMLQDLSEQQELNKVVK